MKAKFWRGGRGEGGRSLPTPTPYSPVFFTIYLANSGECTINAMLSCNCARRPAATLNASPPSLPYLQSPPPSRASLNLHSSNKLATSPLQPYEPTCGNSLLEPGEECDDDSPCCNPNTCKLVPKARCSQGPGWALSPLHRKAANWTAEVNTAEGWRGQCCSDECQFMASTTICKVQFMNE